MHTAIVIAELPLIFSVQVLRRPHRRRVTHSPILPDRLPNESLFVVQRINRKTQVASFETWGPLGHNPDIQDALDDNHEPLPISERILRGDFDA